MLSGLHVPRSAGSRTNNFLRPLTGVGVHNGTLNIINERETRVWWGARPAGGADSGLPPGGFVETHGKSRESEGHHADAPGAPGVAGVSGALTPK